MASRVLIGCLAAILILIVPGFAAQIRIQAGNSSFTPQQKSAFWVSNEKNFTFGFKDAGPAGEYLLSIWLSADPNKTALWWPMFGDDPIVKDGASFRYSSTGSLELYNANGILVWSSSTSSSYAELHETGNLVLLQENQADVWQSFNDSRDTLMLVALQDYERVFNRPYLLQSRRNQSSYEAGTFHLATDVNLSVYFYGLDHPFNNSFVYMISHMSTSNGSVQIGVRFSSRNLAGQRLTLDYDGDLRVYSWESNVSSWNEVWQMLYSDNYTCRLGSPCGPFGICETDAGHNINCSCPNGYYARDVGDFSQGCVSYISFNESCTTSESGSSGNLYNSTMIEVPHSDYYYYDLKTEGYPNVDLDQCKTLCLNDCACMAASYRIADSTCFVKGNSTTGYLMNGYSTYGNTLLMKVVTFNSSNATAGGAEGHVRKGGWLIGVVVAAAVLVAVGTVGCASLLWRRRSSGGARPSIMGWNLGPDEEPDDVVSGAGPVRFHYQELVEATNNFSESLGQGGFGKVYKGWVRGKRGISYTGEKQVAVKVLKGSSRGEERSDSSESQFRAEVLTLGKIHHINLVILLGYCTSGKPGRAQKRLLVYEYMQKGSLDRFLSAAQVQQPLPWATRYSIALGTARGIAYLHHDCNPRILHCDIKPQNVLLDDDFSAKVADFGFARRFRHWGSHLTVSHTCGTRGYMAPEWLKSDGITSKVDVYSFGMLLLELVRGLNTGNDHLPLLHWAFQCISAGVLVLSQLQAGHSTDDNIDVDGPNSVTDVGYREQADNQQEEAAEKLRLLKVGLWCVQPIPSLRPEMSRVVQLIEGTVSAVPNPPNPVPEGTITNLSQILDSGLSSSSYVNSYSILSPR